MYKNSILGGKNMKKLTALLLTGLLSLTLLAGCGGKTETPAENAEQTQVAENVTLKVGATPIPHEELLKFIAPKLEEKGVKLEIISFTDYVQPNAALADGQLDANFFQHLPYLESYNASNGTKLISIGNIHVEPLAFYSQKVKAADELADGATVAIPNDPTNCGRALILLQSKGLIKLSDEAGLEATEKDVVENPKNFEFKPVEAAQLPRILQEVDAAVINGNYAIEASLIPTTDALLLTSNGEERVIEGAESPYANIIAVREEDKENETFKKLVEVLQSDEVKQFIEENYNGGVVPAF